MGKISKNRLTFNQEEQQAADRLRVMVLDVCGDNPPEIIVQVSLQDDGLVRWANIYVDGDDESLPLVRVGAVKFAIETGFPQALINVEKV